MAKFRIQHAPPFDIVTHDIMDKYFTLDTADHAMVDSWIKKNPHYLTYAWDGAERAGFMSILPLTREGGELLERQEILEEELTDKYVMDEDVTRYTEYLYIAGVAIRDVNSYRDKQAAAALMSCGAGMIRHLYDPKHLKKVFANPTTYWGNRIIGRFGLKPVTTYRKPLGAGNDIYEAEATPEFYDRMRALEARYQRFMIDYPWRLS